MQQEDKWGSGLMLVICRLVKQCKHVGVGVNALGPRYRAICDYRGLESVSPHTS